MLALLAASTGCSRRPDTRLTRIAAIVSDHPEMALQDLDSINPDGLSESDRHFHDFLTIKARDKTSVPHVSDSLISTLSTITPRINPTPYIPKPSTMAVVFITSLAIIPLHCNISSRHSTIRAMHPTPPTLKTG